MEYNFYPEPLEKIPGVVITFFRVLMNHSHRTHRDSTTEVSNTVTCRKTGAMATLLPSSTATVTPVSLRALKPGVVRCGTILSSPVCRNDLEL